MTLARGLALKISSAVVRYASPGCKEWAEGVAREVEFVESDWAALRWALGSVRILLNYREAPFKSAEDLIAAAQKFADPKRRGKATWIAFALSAQYFFKFFHASSLLQRTGCVMASAGYLVAGVIALQWHRRLQVPSGDDSLALIRFYKAELERFRDFCSSPKLWLAGFAFTTVCIGTILSEFSKSSGFRAYAIFSAVIVLLWMSTVIGFLWVSRINQMRLERVERFLGRGPERSLP